MSATLTATEVLPQQAPPSAPPPPPAGKAWLVSPSFDLFFLACLFWPIIAVVVMAAGAQSALHIELDFWQQYLLATAHRWITLVIVFGDRERLEERPRAFLGLAAFFLLAIVGVWAGLGTDGLLLLFAIDYFWNAWHFAAQHSGIARIYERVAQPGPLGNALLEKTVLRVFVVAMFFEMFALAVDDKLPARRMLLPVAQAIHGCGLWLLALPGWLIVRECWNYQPARVGRLVYMTSICTVYSCLLVASQYEMPSLVAGFALAITFIHATEYLAIVSWSVKKRHGRTESGIWSYLVPRWTAALVIFMIALGGSMILLSRHQYLVFTLLTVLVSFLHYAYDGMIWKGKRPAPRPAPMGA
jgi:hypothetical protein